MNRIADVAKLLGLELDEEFTVKSFRGNNIRCKITNEGLLEYGTCSGAWEQGNADLYRIISGEYKIKKMPWKAKNNDKYFVPLVMSVKKYDKFYFTADSADDIIYQRGLMCKTSKQAKELSKLLIKTARQFQGFDKEEQEK